MSKGSNMRKLLYIVPLALALAPTAFAANATSVSVAVGAEASITVVAATPLTEAGNFANYTGATNFTYQMRTTTVSGTGSVTMKVTSDFGPTGGPSVTTPPTAGDLLTYSCTGAGTTSPTPCTGPVTASTAASTAVLNVGTDKHSTLAGDTGTVNWTLTNDPNYKTGTYTSTVTFTIAAA